MIIAIILVQWAQYARLMRAAALVERRKEYIEAAVNFGLPTRHIMLAHLLPNSISSVLVVSTISIAGAITLEATLSFLGVGVPVTQPSLGLLIANGFEFLLSGEYWIAAFPGIALVLLIMSLNLVGERLRRSFECEGPMTSPLLEVRGLRTVFHDLAGAWPAVDGVDLVVQPGEVVGLVGESGSGKTVTGFSWFS